MPKGVQVGDNKEMKKLAESLLNEEEIRELEREKEQLNRQLDGGKTYWSAEEVKREQRRVFAIERRLKELRN